VCYKIATSDYSVAVDDSEYEDILIHLPGLCDYIEEALQQGEKVLVHCIMGISRSVTAVAAYCKQVACRTLYPLMLTILQRSDETQRHHCIRSSDIHQEKSVCRLINAL
jgi:hypothetical protein